MHFFPYRFEGYSQLLTVGEETSEGGAEGSADGPSESGQLDEGAGLEFLLGPVHAIRQYKSSLSISVSYLHSQSLSASNDVRRTIGVFVDGVLDQSDAAGEIDS